jgi:hypothetical protein
VRDKAGTPHNGGSRCSLHGDIPDSTPPGEGVSWSAEGFPPSCAAVASVPAKRCRERRPRARPGGRRPGVQPGRRRPERPREEARTASSEGGDDKERGVPLFLLLFPQRHLVVNGVSRQRGVSFIGGSPVPSHFSSARCCRIGHPHFIFSTNHSAPGTPRVRRACLASSAVYFLFLIPPRPCGVPSRFVLIVSSLPSVGGVPIFSESGNSSMTNHGVHFPTPSNRGRSSVSRKGDAGPLSPRVRR